MAEAQAITISEATMELINARAAEQYAEWKANATEEQKAAGLEKLNKFKNDEDFKNQHMARMNNAWNEADADGDGKLNLQEHKNWENKMRALKEADGDWHESDHAEANYAIANSVIEGDGYTMAEMWAVMGPWRQKWEAIKAADGQ